MSATSRRFWAVFEGLDVDLLLALRRIRRDSASTLAIALVLGLGVGSATTAYAAFNYLLFRPVPGLSEASRIVSVRFSSGPNGDVGGLADRTAVPAMRAAAAGVGLEHLAVDGWSVDVPVRSTGSSQPGLVNVSFVFAQYFAVLGVRPRIGRLILDDEAESSASHVALVSESFWERTRARSPDIIGETIFVSGAPFVVVGVVEGFRGFGRVAARVGDTDVWLPVSAFPVVSRGRIPNTTTTLFGRVRPGSVLSLIEERLQSSYAGVASVRPDPRSDVQAPVTVTVSQGLGRYDAVHPGGLRLFWWSIGLTSALCLIAAVNAAGLVLMRFQRRKGDVAIRIAVGGSRWRISRGFLVEALGLSALGGVVGLIAAVIGTICLRTVRLLESFPSLSGLQIDERVVTFCLAVTIGTAVVAGLVPTLAASPRTIRGALAVSGRGASHSQFFLYVLLGAEIALSTLLCMGAVALAQSFHNLLSVDVGARLDHITELRLGPDRHRRYPTSDSPSVAAIVEGLSHSGFRSVVTAPALLDGSSRRITFTVGSSVVDVPLPREYSVSPGLFDLLAIPILFGRDFTAEEAAAPSSLQPMPVVLSATLARALFGVAPPIGRTFIFERVVTVGVDADLAQVVGVVGDVREDNFRRGQRATIYHTRPAQIAPTILIGTQEPADAPRIEAVVQKVDPSLPIMVLRPLENRIAESLAGDRSLATLSGLVAVQAMLLASFGVLAMVGQVVRHRARELSIRSALGASGFVLILSAIRRTLVTTAVGVAIGFAGYVALSGPVQSTLYNTDAMSPLAIAGAAAVIMTMVTVAALIPAYRGSRVDVASVMRIE